MKQQLGHWHMRMKFPLPYLCFRKVHEKKPAANGCSPDLNPKQAGLFADWYGSAGGGRFCPPL